jgi:hypothetical protein
MAHRTLDDIAYDNDHAEPVHPLRELWAHNFYLDGLVNTEGGLWILLMDALLFVPLMMAAFFYPWQSLLVGIVALAVSFAAYEGWVIWERRHHV